MTKLQEFQTLSKKVKDKIKNLQHFSEVRWGVAPEMYISYDLDSIETLGSANHRKGTMRLNKHLLIEFGDKYIDEIVVHEYAHFVVRARMLKGDYFGRPKPHGQEFKAVCGAFGIPGNATTRAFKDSKHLNDSYERHRDKKKIFYYSCNCSSKFFELSIVRHNKILKGKARYSCPTCGGTLKFQKTRK